jgi:xylulose-5-phosphate/fructose-6-phosphate phosphoketolase
MLEDWLRSYEPNQLFDRDGQFRPDLAQLAPTGNKRMGMNPHANGGLLLEPLERVAS